VNDRDDEALRNVERKEAVSPPDRYPKRKRLFSRHLRRESHPQEQGRRVLVRVNCACLAIDAKKKLVPSVFQVDGEFRGIAFQAKHRAEKILPRE
jgi:hypothetical protein